MVSSLNALWNLCGPKSYLPQEKAFIWKHQHLENSFNLSKSFHLLFNFMRKVLPVSKLHKCKSSSPYFFSLWLESFDSKLHFLSWRYVNYIVFSSKHSANFFDFLSLSLPKQVGKHFSLRVFFPIKKNI